jgi:hypothetical protein
MGKYMSKIASTAEEERMERVGTSKLPSGIHISYHNIMPVFLTYPIARVTGLREHRYVISRPLSDTLI